MPITQVALASGFGSVRRFNAAVKARWGVSPTLFRKRLSQSLDVDNAVTVTLKLQFRPPLDWPHVLDFLRARSLPTVEYVTQTHYRRVVCFNYGGDQVTGHISVSQRKENELWAEFSDSLLPHMSLLVPKLRRLFDLDANPAAIGHAWNESRDSHRLWQRWPGTRVPGVWSPFEVAVRAVLGQQISVKAAITLVTRFVARFGKEIPHAAQEENLTHSFPEPADLLDADMGGLGITARRINTIKALAAGFAGGELDFETGEPEEQRRRLLAIKGIGPWTVAYMGLRGLSDPDAFPAGDLILRRGLVLGEEFSEKQLEAHSQAWRPWRAYAALLLWRHYNAGGLT